MLFVVCVYKNIFFYNVIFWGDMLLNLFLVCMDLLIW